jgi:hypothetical protein
MRFREIMEQSAFPEQVQDAIPGAQGFGSKGDPIGPSNYYHKYRLGVAMSSSPDYLENVTEVGPASDDMVTIAYTQADQDKITGAYKKLGYKPQQLTHPGSTENESVNTQSIIPKRKKNRYGV